MVFILFFISLLIILYAHPISDVVDSRINIASCEFHKFCKCKQETCYYSDPDPCTCSKRYKPCAAGETMNEVGGLYK